MKAHSSTTSCCPICLKILPAEKVVEGNNVYLSRQCPEHGDFKILVSRDSERFFDKTFCSEGKAVYEYQTKVAEGCPSDCGWCPDHRQHLCTALIEITDACNMHCPVCYFGQSGSTAISLDEFDTRLATVMRTENGSLDVLQISGGEPTLHPEFPEIVRHALQHKIGRILINTNGLPLLQPDEAFNVIRDNRDRVEVYLQYDGSNSAGNRVLRGTDLSAQKELILKALNDAGIKICLAVTVIPETISEIRSILAKAIGTENITGITFQRFTKTGRGFNLSQSSLTQEDILQAIHETHYLKYEHIVPLPCSHENCTSLSFLFIVDGKTYPLGQYIDFAKHQHVIKDKIGFDSAVLDYLKEQIAGAGRGCCSWLTNLHPVMQKLIEFTDGKASSYKNMKMLRIVVKNFMDAETFDTERAKKCCVGVSIGGERIIPFCVNNIFQYRGRFGESG